MRTSACVLCAVDSSLRSFLLAPKRPSFAVTPRSVSHGVPVGLTSGQATRPVAVLTDATAHDLRHRSIALPCSISREAQRFSQGLAREGAVVFSAACFLAAFGAFVCKRPARHANSDTENRVALLGVKGDSNEESEFNLKYYMSRYLDFTYLQDLKRYEDLAARLTEVAAAAESNERDVLRERINSIPFADSSSGDKSAQTDKVCQDLETEKTAEG